MKDVLFVDDILYRGPLSSLLGMLGHELLCARLGGAVDDHAGLLGLRRQHGVTSELRSIRTVLGVTVSGRSGLQRSSMAFTGLQWWSMAGEGGRLQGGYRVGRVQQGAGEKTG